jgi:hypothetical protein
MCRCMDSSSLYSLVTSALTGSTSFECSENNVRDSLRALGVARTYGHLVGRVEQCLRRDNQLYWRQTSLIEGQVGHNQRPQDVYDRRVEHRGGRVEVAMSSAT